MDKAYIHHAGGHFVTLRTDKGFDMLAVGAGTSFVARRARPGVHVEIEAADSGVAGRVISVREVRFGGEISFELDPIKTVDVAGSVGFNKSVKFADSNVIENPAVGADIFGGFRQVYLHIRVVRGRDG